MTRLVRGTGPGEVADDGRVLTVTQQAPALVALDAAGTLLDESNSLSPGAGITPR